MSFVHGKRTEVWLGGLDLSGYLDSIDFSADTDAADVTTFRNDWKSYVTGQSGADIGATGFYEPTTAVPSLEALIGADPTAVLTIGPGGLHAAGDRARLVSVSQTAYRESSKIGGAVAFDWAVLPDGDVGFGHVLHALGAETADGNGGSGVDDGPDAASDTGAVAHLHVSSVSASDSVVVSIEDASVPSGGGANWLTIGTFAGASAAGSQRLVIAGTVRRYLRAAWDVTGSSVSIVFGVAVART